MKLLKIYILVAIIFYPLIFIAKYLNLERWEQILVPTFVSIVFVANLIVNPLSEKNSIFLFTAFLFVCAGDFMVNLTNWGGWFIIPFVLVHVSFIIYYSLERPWKLSDLKILVPLLAMIIAIQILAFPILEKQTYKIAFLIYTCILMLMLWRAICYTQTKAENLSKILVIAGASLFMVTDICVALNVVLETKTLVAITWICYTPGLTMLSLMNFPIKNKL